MEEYELEDTTEIQIADYPLAKWFIVVIILTVLTCIVYFFLELKRPEPPAEEPQTEAVSLLDV